MKKYFFIMVFMFISVNANARLLFGDGGGQGQQMVNPMNADSTNIGNSPQFQATQIYQRPAPMTIADEYYGSGGSGGGSNSDGPAATGTVSDSSGNSVSDGSGGSVGGGDASPGGNE